MELEPFSFQSPTFGVLFSSKEVSLGNELIIRILPGYNWLLGVSLHDQIKILALLFQS